MNYDTATADNQACITIATVHDVVNSDPHAGMGEGWRGWKGPGFQTARGLPLRNNSQSTFQQTGREV